MWIPPRNNFQNEAERRHRKCRLPCLHVMHVVNTMHQQVPDDRSTGYFEKELNWVSVFLVGCHLSNCNFMSSYKSDPKQKKNGHAAGSACHKPFDINDKVATDLCLVLG